VHPAALIVVCGDNDHATKVRTGRNPGIEKAEQAARTVHGAATWPEGLPDEQSDFNDLHQLKGLDAVRDRVAATIERARSGVNERKSGSASGRSDEDSGLSCDRFQVSDKGVFFLESDQDGHRKAPQWVCSRLDVVARTRDEDGQGWGYLLTFPDPMGNVRTWAMPARMLAGDGAEYRAALLNMGLRIASGANARNRLGQYLQSRQPKEMARCADRVGWHGQAYVLPRITIGGDGERIVYQVDGITENPFKQRGTVAHWRERIAALCVGNDRLLFALSCAFAGALVRHSGIDSGGFHLRGGSSCGKTTALKVAGSAWGGPSYLQRWRSTDNALEAIAAQHCDGLLILDELAQVDPKTAGECAYMLANETGKARSTRTGQARPRLSWRLLFLSAGEISLAQHMAEGGKRSKAGQELRLADVPADAGVGFGLFNELHDYPSGAAMSTELSKACEAQHGAAGIAYLEWLVSHLDTLRDRTRDGIDHYAGEWIPEAASGQVQRVGRRFALVAIAGELATEAGITGWPPGEAARGVLACFNAWLASRGGIGDAEEGQMVRQVKRLLEERGAGNFAWWHRAADDRAPNPTERWGFRRLVDGSGKAIKTNSDHMKEYGEVMRPADGEETSIEYFVFPEVFRNRLCEGFDHNAVAKLLVRRGHLMPGPGDRYDRRERLPGIGNATVYRIKSTIFADDGAGD
jgi:putative DNA primase/helicase